MLWGNAAYAFAANAARAFVTYGWCVRIRGIDRGGVVEGLPVLTIPTADGDVDRRTVTEIASSERARRGTGFGGLIPLVHRKNTNVAAFVSAQSLQAPVEYADASATINPSISARLPYLFACCRFAHYLKCMVRDKIGGSLNRNQLQEWLRRWLIQYVDGYPTTPTRTTRPRTRWSRPA